MAKNSKSAAQKRHAKALKRRTKNKKAKGLRIQAAQSARAAQKKMALELSRTIEKWKSDPMGYGFWACQGINYIASDMEQGLWDPPFPGIYEDNQGAFPEAAEVQKYITDMIDPENPKFSKIGRTLIGYWFSGVEGMYAIAQGAIKAAEEAGEDPHGQAQASVWGVFADVHEQMQEKMGDQHLLESAV